MIFLNPGMLWGLLALAIPVLIHLFNFQRTEKILFANTQLLTEVIQQTRKAKQVRNRLLLLVRLLGLTFLILAFAQPAWNSGTEAQNGELPRVGVFVDNSSSMFFPDDGNRAFEKAISMAQGIPDSYFNKGWFEVISHDFLSRHTWTSASGYRDHLLEIGPSQESRTLSSLLSRAERQFDLQSGNGQKSMYILSDFQKSHTGDLLKISFDSTIQYRLFPIGHNSKSNVWIDSVWLPRPISSEVKENEIRVLVSNSGEKVEKSVRLQLFANGNLLSGIVVKLNPGATSVCSLPVRIKPGEKLNCRLTLDDSEISFDNDFYFTLQAPKPVSVYLISDKRESFLEKLFNNKSLFRFSRSGSSNPDYHQIETADFVVLEGGPSGGNSLQESLIRKISEGGTVCLIPGDQTTWLQEFGKKTGLEISVSPGSLKPSDWKIDFPGKESSFFKDVFQEGVQNKVKAYSQPSVKIGNGISLLHYESGDPFLVEKKTAGGKIFVLASALSEKAGSLPGHPLMIPMFYRMAFSSAQTEMNQLYVLAGQTSVVLPLDSMPPGNESAVELVRENQRILANLSKTKKAVRLILPEESLPSGFWEIRKAGISLGFLAINSSGVESTTDFYSEEELKEAFKSKPWIRIQGIEGNASHEHLKNEKSDEISLWKYCIWVAILMFALEMVMVRFRKSRGVN